MKFYPLMSFLGLFALSATLAFGTEYDYDSWRKDQDAKFCSLHKSKMTEKEIPIRYGYPGLSEYEFKEFKAKNTLFPHAKDFSQGSCMPLLGVEKEKVFECTICRKIKTDWLKANPKPKNEKS